VARSTFDQRKEDILEAAITVFARNGYDRVTTADISREAGISQPYIYRFFATKEELFLAVVDRVYGRVAASLLTLLDAVEGAFDRHGLEEPRTRAEDFLARGVLCNLSLTLDAPGLFRPRIH